MASRFSKQFKAFDESHNINFLGALSVVVEEAREKATLRIKVI